MLTEAMIVMALAMPWEEGSHQAPLSKSPLMHRGGRQTCTLLMDVRVARERFIVVDRCKLLRRSRRAVR